MTSSTLDRPYALDVTSPTDPVLAVVEIDDPAPEVLHRAAAAAAALGCAVHVVLLEPAVGWTTSPALVASANRRRSAQLARCRQLIAEVLGPDPVEVTVHRSSPRPRSRQRAIAREVRRTGARLVFTPASVSLPAA